MKKEIIIKIIVVFVTIAIFLSIIIGNKKKSNKTNLNSNQFNSSLEYTNSNNYNQTNTNTNKKNNRTEPMDKKPIIYLYPTQETNISVKLGYSDKITCSYPKYKNGWNVLAKTNGELFDLDNKRNLYALYYESEMAIKFKIENEGFIVKGTNVAEFLENKLEMLGLNEREIEEFIVYWLPKLQENKYNYIRFATMDEINSNMPLEFSVEPDSLIRVLMTYKGLEKPIDIQEQKLEKPKREGFVAVEWGGTEIN